MEDKRPKIHPLPKNAKKVFTGTIYDTWQWEQELYDGTTATYERLSRPDYAHVTVVLPDQRIMLLEDEQPDREAVLTPAGGKVDPGEDVEKAAHRELKEETGYEVEELVPWHNYRPSSKIEYQVHGFIGRGGKKVAEKELEGGEKTTEKFYTFDEFLELGHNPMLRDWMIRLILLEAKIDQTKKEELKKLLYG